MIDTIFFRWYNVNEDKRKIDKEIVINGEKIGTIVKFSDKLSAECIGLGEEGIRLFKFIYTYKRKL